MTEEEWKEYPGLYFSKLPKALMANPAEKKVKGERKPRQTDRRADTRLSWADRTGLWSVYAGAASLRRCVSLCPGFLSRDVFSGRFPAIKKPYEIRSRLMPLVPYWCITMKHTADHACFGRLRRGGFCTFACPPALGPAACPGWDDKDPPRTAWAPAAWGRTGDGRGRGGKSCKGRPGAGRFSLPFFAVPFFPLRRVRVRVRCRYAEPSDTVHSYYKPHWHRLMPPFVSRPTTVRDKARMQARALAPRPLANRFPRSLSLQPRRAACLS